MQQGDLLDVREAAAYLKLNEQTVRRLARERQIPGFKVGGSWRFKRSVLDRWTDSQHTESGKAKILVVDDDKAILEFVVLTLAKEGFEVTKASGGEQALELMRQDVPDLVILDLKIPGMDGPAVLKEIRRRWGRLPVVILTGYPDSELMHRALQHSPLLVLAKPAGREQILHAIEQALAPAATHASPT